MSKKICELILKIGAILSLGSFFIIIQTMYFPYVSGKQLYFNILIETLTVVWFYLILKYPEARPKKSWLTWSLVIWLLVLLASAIFGVDFNLSFWGDTERLLGIFSLLHFFALYLIIITVFKTKNDWLAMLNVSVLAMAILAAYAFITANGGHHEGNVNLTSNISTLGNATYVAGVMLFGIFFIFYLWRQTRNLLVKLWYLIALALVVVAFFYADVSGSQAGLVISLLLYGLLLGLLHKNRRVKIISLASVSAVVVIIALSVVLAFSHAPILHNKIGTMITDFSTNNTSLRARFYAWQAGWQGFKDRPILGWGAGNFAAPFDKHFTGGLYQVTPNEEYYDRAHDMPIEMMATAGIFGLLAYLGIFAAVIWCLIGAWRRQTIKPLAVAVIVGVFTAYFVHNLAVFDSLANYILLMVAMAFTYWLTTGQDEASVSKQTLTGTNINIIVAVAGLFACWLIYYANFLPIIMLRATVTTANSWYNASSAQFLADYQKTFAYNTPLDRDSRTLISGLILSSPQKLSDLPEDQVRQFFDSLVKLNQANLQLNPNDYFFILRQAQILSLIGSVTRDEGILKQSLVVADQAIAIGGNHVQSWLVKTNIYLSLNDNQQADDNMRHVLDIFPGYTKIYCRLANIELQYPIKISEQALWSNLDNCLDSGQTVDLGNGIYLTKAVKHYQAIKDNARLKIIQPLMRPNIIVPQP